MDFPVGSIVNNYSGEQLKQILSIPPITCKVCTKEAHGAVKEVPQAEITIWNEKQGQLSISLCDQCCQRIAQMINETVTEERNKRG